MGVTVGIIAIKGGVGKTTIASSLAVDLAQRCGKKVMLIDANYSAPNVGLHLDILAPEKTIHDVLAGRARMQHTIREKYGVDVVPGNAAYLRGINPLLLRTKLAPLKKRYDFIVIDSSPSLNDEVLSAMLASDTLFVVTTGDYPTLSSSLSAARLARQRGKPIAGLILNKIRDPRYELSLEDLEYATDIPVVARIPDEGHHVRSLFLRVPVVLYRKRSAFSREIAALSALLTHEPERMPFFARLLPRFLRKEVVNRQFVKEQLYTSTLPVLPLKTLQNLVQGARDDSEAVMGEVIRGRKS